MSKSSIEGFRIAGVATCVPARVVDNTSDSLGFDAGEVRKVVAMAGVQQRLGWERDSITGLILVTQSPDYFLPSTSCMLHHWLGLSDQCAAFDVGLGWSCFP